MRSATDWNSIEAVIKLAAEQEKSLGATSPLLAETLTQLADLYFIDEEFMKAEPLYWRALTIRQKALGEWHPSTAATLQNLAELYEIQDRYAEAQRFYMWATSARKTAKLKEHSDKLDSTVTIEAKLPRISDMAAANCKKCGRKLLDATVCMYCTAVGDFDAMAYLRAVQGHRKPDKQEAGPVNVLLGMDGQEQYSLDDPEITIGRHPSNKICLGDDKAVSRMHAKVEFASGDFFIDDLKSANGTYVNSEKITAATKLKLGDVVTMGNRTLIVGCRR